MGSGRSWWWCSTPTQTRRRLRWRSARRLKMASPHTRDRCTCLQARQTGGFEPNRQSRCNLPRLKCWPRSRQCQCSRKSSNRKNHPPQRRLRRSCTPQRPYNPTPRCRKSCCRWCPSSCRRSRTTLRRTHKNRPHTRCLRRSCTPRRRYTRKRSIRKSRIHKTRRRGSRRRRSCRRHCRYNLGSPTSLRWFLPAPIRCHKRR